MTDKNTPDRTADPDGIVLDTTWYPGEDLYSDGEIEDAMLSFVREVPSQKRNRAIAEAASWPVLYHFSHIRGHIVSFLPFEGGEKVLEIGSGCGAVTETLCALAGDVTAVDLSLKRSRINAERCRGFSNLKILVGNFEDIEPHLPCNYDVITLIGVFEYGQSYIHSEAPYEDFLEKVAAHLAPHGRLLIAIENRFGLKYWAGCTEDHTGRLFDGLEGYPQGGSARTFTRGEWEELLKKAGGLHAQWYYPWPDYKFPMDIYSDSRLPRRGEAGGGRENFDRLRLSLFDEGAVCDALTENGLFAWFANSYLLVITRQKEPPVPVIYSHFSDERAGEFAVRTDLVSHSDRITVKKTALSGSNSHIQSIKKKTDALMELYRDSGFLVNRLSAGDCRSIFLEYVPEPTLEEVLDRELFSGRVQEVIHILLDYAGRIRKVCSRDPFVLTEEFGTVFGNACRTELFRKRFGSSDDGLHQSAPVCNIDLLAHNLIPSPDGGEVQVLDVEWTFFFPVPADYVVWRFLHYYMEGAGHRHPLKNEDLYGRSGLAAEDLPVFAAMEEDFQRYILGSHVPMRLMYERISPGAYRAADEFSLVRAAMAPRVLQAFFDRGKDFVEEDSVRLPLTLPETILEIPSGTRRLRMDPGEAPGGLLVRSLTWDHGEQAGFRTNGFPLGPDRFYYPGGDPQLILDTVPSSAKQLHIEVCPLQEEHAREEFRQSWVKKEAEEAERRRDLENRLALANEKIAQMEGTKVWRLYRKIKHKE